MDFTYGGIFDAPQEEPDADLKNVFNDYFLPKVSTLSVSTRSNRSYDTFDLDEMNFIDEFLLEKPLITPMEEEISELSVFKEEIPQEGEVEAKKSYQNSLEVIEEVR